MGLSQLPRIAARLIEGGRRRQHASRGDRQRQHAGAAGRDRAPRGNRGSGERRPIDAPALIVIGDVVRFRDLLATSALSGALLTASDQVDSRVEPGPARFGPIGIASAHVAPRRSRNG